MNKVSCVYGTYARGYYIDRSILQAIGACRQASVQFILLRIQRRELVSISEFWKIRIRFTMIQEACC